MSHSNQNQKDIEMTAFVKASRLQRTVYVTQKNGQPIYIIEYYIYIIYNIIYYIYNTKSCILYTEKSVVCSDKTGKWDILLGAWITFVFYVFNQNQNQPTPQIWYQNFFLYTLSLSHTLPFFLSSCLSPLSPCNYL